MVRGVHAFAERNVDAEIFHRGVEELFDGFGKAVDFVDEQDRAFFGVGEIGNQVFGGHEGCTAGDLNGRADFARDAGGEGGFAQARRAVEENMAQRFVALAGGIEGDFEALGHFALADHVFHALRRRRRSSSSEIFCASRSAAVGWTMGSRMRLLAGGLIGRQSRLRLYGC